MPFNLIMGVYATFLHCMSRRVCPWSPNRKAGPLVVRFDETLAGALGGLAQNRFELGEGLLDRVEVGAVGWQVDEPGALRGDRFGDAAAISWLLKSSSRTVSSGRSVGSSICST
jgi:hypothetical protein